MIDYLEFFGLKEDPFRITPDPNFFFPSKSHRQAEKLLKFVVDNGEGFCVIIGEPGVGKTTVLRRFLRDVESQVIYALILNPTLNPEEFLKTVLNDFGLDAENKEKDKLLKDFKKFLEETVKKGKKILIVVDEAQNLPVETIEELRLLSNLETDKEKLVQIILVGQPELDDKLRLPQLRQLNQRITNKAYIVPLDFEDTKKYIIHRLMLAGQGSVNFTESAFKKIYKYSKGIPRIINILSSRALMAAFMENSYKIKPENVEIAVETIDPSILDIKGKRKSLLQLLLIFLTTLNIALILFIIYKLTING